MYSFEIYNIHTGETSIVFGYWWEDAARRSNLVEEDWIIRLCVYED